MPTFALASALSFHHLEDGPRDFPRVRVWGTLAWILAGLLISYLDLEPTATPLRISAGTSLLTALYCLLLPHTPPKPRLGQRSLRDFIGPEVRGLLRRPSFAVLLACLTLISIPSGFYYSFTNPFLSEIGMPNPAAKMSIGQMSEVLLMLIMPFFFRRLGFKWVITIGLAAWGVRYALFALGNADELAWMLWVGLLLHGVAFNFTALTGQIYVDRIAPPQVRNTAQGLMSMVTLGLGALIGAYLAGEVVDHFTLADGRHLWRAIWLVPALVGLLTTLIFAAFFRDREGEEDLRGPGPNN
jgi:nucleoside transporter